MNENRHSSLRFGARRLAALACAVVPLSIGLSMAPAASADSQPSLPQLCTQAWTGVQAAPNTSINQNSLVAQCEALYIGG